ncbi:MAG: metal-dependent hydrolase [Patescibacteria group bacterium]|jgi:hypothetical protein
MLMDFGIGALLSVLFTRLFGIETNIFHIFAGAFFAVLPDMDVPFELVKRKKLGGKEHGFHREYTHYPIFYIPLCFLVLVTFGGFWASLLASCLLFHTLHDCIWMGWGLRLLWPFSRKRYKFFSDKEGFWSKRLLCSWNDQELKSVSLQYGLDNWFSQYIRFKPVCHEEIMIKHMSGNRFARRVKFISPLLVEILVFLFGVSVVARVLIGQQ